MGLQIFNFEAIPTLTEVDILIVGAGSAGCIAALAARESKPYSVMLIERYGFAGGTSTQILDTFYGFFTPGENPLKVAGGLPDRVVNRLDERQGIFLRPNTYGAGTGVTYNPELLKLVWDELLIEAGVRLLLHTNLVAVETDTFGNLKCVVVTTRGGLFKIKARRFIDTSGDAELCHLANVPYEKAGDKEPAQTMTTTFRMSNVDMDTYQAAGGKKKLTQLMDEALKQGTHSLPRRAGSVHRMVQKACVATVAVRVADLDPTDSVALTEAEIAGRRQAFIYEQFFRECVPGYQDSHIIGLSHQIGIRESRRVCGEYRLTKEDCIDARRFEDVVLLCGAPIEDHRQDKNGEEETHWEYVSTGRAYDVPYRTLVPKDRDELWVAGRCFSATHDAHASCRSMAQTMSMGQAVGLAATLSLETDSGARTLDIDTLQDRLGKLGAILKTPALKARTGPEDWKENPPFKASH